MELKKGMTFLLSETPHIVGVITSIKDLAGQRYNLSLTNGENVIWYNKTKRFSFDVGLSPLTEENLLTIPEKKVEEAFDDSYISAPLNDGDVYLTTEGVYVLMMDLDSPVTIFGIEYDFAGVSRFGDLGQMYYTINGKCSSRFGELENFVRNVSLMDFPFNVYEDAGETDVH